MTDRDKNNKKQKQQLITKTISNKNLTHIAYLYGMTLEEYKEGAKIHSKCFGQLKTARTVAHS
ncbi:hypothetical protein [Flavobacterium panacagri]|uniref:hypothetical protein n=1 Tax=Flavobacterium panacagri TaxID=3034146 RepID=UPI0025A55D03|nr:hypothetical protein [Flavobacterium panacagri]